MNETERTRLAPDVRRAQVLTAARDVFLRSGLLGTTVKGVADDAGLYAHFESKDELYQAAVQEPLERLSELITLPTSSLPR